MNPVRNFCSNCGQPIDAKARFCAGCGNEIASAGSQQSVSPPVFQPSQVNTQPPVYQSPPAPQQPTYPVPNYQAPPVYNAPPVYAPPAAAVPGYGYQMPGTAVPGEAIIGMIPNASRKKNLISSETFNIVVTNHRFIFALMTSQMIKEAAAQHRGTGIGGFFKAMGSGYTLWERYLQMPPEMALQENPENFTIYINQIRKVKFPYDKVLYSKGPFSVGLKVGVGVGSDDDDDNTTVQLEIETAAGKYKFDVNSYNQQQAAETLKKAGLIK